jgi:hypothetical protein
VPENLRSRHQVRLAATGFFDRRSSHLTPVLRETVAGVVLRVDWTEFLK